MNLFRSEEHARRWTLYYRDVDDYIMPVSDWGTVFSASMFQNRLETDYLAHSAEYLADYRSALQAMGKSIPAAERFLSTILFTDIVDSTARAAALRDAEWRSLLERHNTIVRTQLEHFSGTEVKHTGDGIMATFDSPARAIQCAVAITELIRDIGLQVRAGIHAGEIEVFDDGLGGIAIHIGARVAAAAGPNEVLVSRTVKDAVIGSSIDFEDRGVHELKGVPGQWELYAALVPSS